MEGNFSRENPKERKEEPDYEKIAKDVAGFANEIGKDNYRHKIDYIALEFYRTNRSALHLTMLLQSSEMWTSYIKHLLQSRGVDPEQGELYSREYEAEERKILNGFDFQNEKAFKDLIRDISSKNLKPETFLPKKEKIGMLTFNDHFDKSGEFDIHIHLPSKINGEGGFNANPARIKESLEILCDKLVEQRRAPRNITAQSWLMGVEPIRKRMGLDVLKTYEFSKSDYYEDGRFRGLTPSIWGQFVDKDGLVKEEEVEYLFKNGHPRYELTKAGISFPQLIEKYGQKYKGKTIEFLNFPKYNLEKEKINQLRRRLATVMEGHDKKAFEEFLVFARENEFFRKFLDMDIGARFIQLTQEALEKDDPENFLRENRGVEMTDIGGQFNLLKEQYLESVKNKTITMTL